MPNSGARPAPDSSGGLALFIRRKIQAASRCIGWRLVVLLVTSLVIFLGASGWLALELHRRHLLSLLEENAIGIGETILSSAHSSMLENDQQHLAQIFESIGRREDVLALRLVDAHGQVRHSSDLDEIGLISDLDAPLCQGCHANGEPRSPETLRDGLQLYSLPQGKNALGLGVPVLNSPDCSGGGCHVHPSSQRVLGMLDLELSILPLETDMQAARRQALSLALITVVIISATLGLLSWRVVHRPISALLTGTRRVGSGDLSFRIVEIPSGEIGELASSFNEMSGRLQEAHHQLEEWNQRLEGKVEEKATELREARDQMVFAEKMASLGKLAAIVAHEINNPLAGVLVYVKLIRRQMAKLPGNGEEEPEARRYQEMDQKLSEVEAEIARCGDIVRNLLLFSRHRESERAPTDLNTVVERSLKLVQHQADLAGISTELNLDSKCPAVTCESAQIQQAVVALIMNGLEAMSDGGTLSLRTRYDQERDEVQIDIQDTGAGIPPELQDKMFEPFFSTKSEGKGTGLGLSVMYGIIQRHDGRAEFDTRTGTGTTFRLYLPAHPTVVGMGAASGERVEKGAQ